MGSSAGVLPVCVGDAAVVVVSPPEAVLSELRRFIVGRSGSSAGVVVLLVVEPFVEPASAGALGAVVEVPELSRRFMVGRSESSLVDGLVVLAVVVVSGLLLVWAVVGVVVWVSGLV